MMSEIELKPCPFCGGKAKFALGEEYREEHKQANDWVECESCGVETAYFDTAEEAAEAWNRRVRKAYGDTEDVRQEAVYFEGTSADHL